GLEIYLIEEPKELAKHLYGVRPHLFTAVPRILEQMYKVALVAKTEKKFLGKYLLNWAFRHGTKYKEKKGLDPSKWIKMLLFRTLIFRRFRRAIGGKLKCIVVGAAHMNPAISRTFALGGIPIREGYGMTETSPVVTVNRMKPGLNAYGTVGLPLPGVRIKIDQPNEEGVGEILVKGPNVMRGYFKEPEATQQVLTADGWLHTGDMGHFVKKRFLQITDRKKDIFKTSAGKYIAPQLVEAHFRESRFIDQLLVIGFKRPFLSALILPNFAALAEWAEEEGVHWTSPLYMVLNIKVKDQLQQEINELNQDLPGHERIQEFHLLHEPWTQESGLLSHTLKPIRPLILGQYEKEIEQMYQEGRQ
ncbi:MAG: AMP-binding protein, partial [Bacteroidota bacterium]